MVFLKYAKILTARFCAVYYCDVKHENNGNSKSATSEHDGKKKWVIDGIFEESCRALSELTYLKVATKHFVDSKLEIVMPRNLEFMCFNYTHW
jgi:hypothetical protein